MSAMGATEGAQNYGWLIAIVGLQMSTCVPDYAEAACAVDVHKGILLRGG